MISSSSSSVAITLGITNTNGYIYVGLGFANSSTPSVGQLKQGMDGNSSYLPYWAYAYVNQSYRQLFNFSNLTNSTYFNLYYMASNDDLTEDGLTSSVIMRSVYTFGGRMAGSVIFAVILALILIAY